MSDAEPEQESGRASLWRKPKRWFMFGIPLGGFVAFAVGAVAWIGMDYAIEASSSTEFCIGCHEMAAFVYPEYEASTHFSSHSGVGAECKSCHVPKPLFAKLWRKTKATAWEVPHWLMGTIDTQEKYDARKPILAQRVWDYMEKTDSRECRNCHNAARMSFENQDRFAARKHQKAFEQGQTCIECHKGVVHSLPESMDEDGDDDDDEKAASLLTPR